MLCNRSESASSETALSGRGQEVIFCVAAESASLKTVPRRRNLSVPR
jgi:hypothetical protein